MPTKQQLQDSMKLAVSFLRRTIGPNLVVNDPEIGRIDEGWDLIIPGQTINNPPLVMVVPETGGIVGTLGPFTDSDGVTYNQVALIGGLDKFRYLQPNDTEYAKVQSTSVSRDVSGTPKTVVAESRILFLDDLLNYKYVDVRKTFKWGDGGNPEYEYGVKIAEELGPSYLVFLPDRLVNNDGEYHTIWKSGSSPGASGPTNPNRAAAVPGLSPMFRSVIRWAGVASGLPNAGGLARGVERFYAENGVPFELYDILFGFSENMGGSPHWIHSNEAFLPGAKTHIERPRFGWWWWPTRTGTPVTRAAYTSLHFPWSPNARTAEALWYLFNFNDSPAPVRSQASGIEVCHEWLKELDWDGSGVNALALVGALGTEGDHGQHLPYTADSFPTALPYPVISMHGAHIVYSGDWLSRFCVASGYLYFAAKEAGLSRIADEARTWLLDSVDVLMALQIPWNGVFTDDRDEEWCLVDMAGLVHALYRRFNGEIRPCRSPIAEEQLATLIGGLVAGASRQQVVGDTQFSGNFEAGLAQILAFALAYHAVDLVADAGSAQTVGTGATVTLDGAASSHPDGDTLTYAWTQIAGPTVSLSDATDASPTFTAPDATADLTFRLTVEDSSGASDSDKVTITVRDLTPAALGNLDAAVGDGYADQSWDDPSDSSITSYQHRTQEAGSQWGGWTTIPQSGATTTSYRKTGLTNGTEHWFEIRAVNEHGPGASAQVGPVTPTAPASQPTNRRPSANAGPNQIVNRDEVVTLDGTASRDRGGSGTISHSWRQTQGPRVSLTGADTARPTFTAPSSPTYLRFRLTVTDSHGVTDIDAVVVRVTDSPDSAAVSNLPPVANAGPDQTVTPGGEVALDGSGSLDPDSGDTLSYVWRQTVGPSVVLSSTTVANPTFTAPSSPTTLRFRLTVTDSYGAIDIDAVVITVQ